jgi:hypothetical protein
MYVTPAKQIEHNDTAVNVTVQHTPAPPLLHIICPLQHSQQMYKQWNAEKDNAMFHMII